jgi:hypothetical protein
VYQLDLVLVTVVEVGCVLRQLLAAGYTELVQELVNADMYR